MPEYNQVFSAYMMREFTKWLVKMNYTKIKIDFITTFLDEKPQLKNYQINTGVLIEYSE